MILTADAPLWAKMLGLWGMSAMTLTQGDLINNGDMYSPDIRTRYSANQKNCTPENRKLIILWFSCANYFKMYHFNFYGFYQLLHVYLCSLIWRRTDWHYTSVMLTYQLGKLIINQSSRGKFLQILPQLKFWPIKLLEIEDFRKTQGFQENLNLRFF